ncbi:MAG: hypothetical protein COB20_07030 [SAR86 cluster bacterium]|uniref:Uncharacterized protein n=1 Tax=SAR86 cluster bacterium TaxID=2030880 RepID=A0A2A4X764_9GAMM|nr:MAG: hypothetical protein COB20_07030 [SAR86 cluster bacterium]
MVTRARCITASITENRSVITVSRNSKRLWGTDRVENLRKSGIQAVLAILRLLIGNLMARNAKGIDAGLY